MANKPPSAHDSAAPSANYGRGLSDVDERVIAALDGLTEDVVFRYTDQEFEIIRRALSSDPASDLAELRRSLDLCASLYLSYCDLDGGRPPAVMARKWRAMANGSDLVLRHIKALTMRESLELDLPEEVAAQREGRALDPTMRLETLKRDLTWLQEAARVAQNKATGATGVGDRTTKAQFAQLCCDLADLYAGALDLKAVPRPSWDEANDRFRNDGVIKFVAACALPLGNSASDAAIDQMLRRNYFN